MISGRRHEDGIPQLCNATLTSKTEFLADFSRSTWFSVPECRIKGYAFGNQQTCQKSRYQRQLLVIRVFYKTNFGGRKLEYHSPTSVLVTSESYRAQRRPWTPSFSLAVRLLFLVRISGAMYSNIDDCDEGRSRLPFKSHFCFNRVLLVYNFWEPLHFLEQGYGFQTWELSPKFALRSWAYILLHYLPPRGGQLLASGDKVRFLFYYSELLVN